MILRFLLIVGLSFGFVYANITLCSRNEAVIFSCDMKKKKLSVCKKNHYQYVYRYGTRKKVELEITAKPKFSSEQFIRAQYESHLRFHNKGYDYIVYSNELLVYDKNPYDETAHYEEHNGVYVVKDRKVLVKLRCKKMYPYMKGISSIINYVPKEKYIGY